MLGVFLAFVGIYLVLAGSGYVNAAERRVRRSSKRVRPLNQDATTSFAALSMIIRQQRPRLVLAGMRSLRQTSLSWLLPTELVFLIAVVVI